ncbi:hypothetical protein HPB50_000321 [Hyalomma asiaticum]|uniref:Uncharacterized protein n=1 Tax=Hyalomma asiaticum TaxID=266040 RepID=A0ACB7TA42_HYAAI|nr:hypothetical protein HPB50_000321 [Hyalomma asiaticum]
MGLRQGAVSDTSFSWGSSTARNEMAAADIGAAAGGFEKVMTIGQLREPVANANLIPRNLGYIGFALADEDFVATEDLTIEEPPASGFKKETIADNIALDVEGDSVGALQAEASAAAIVAVDTSRMYLGSEPGICAQLNNPHKMHAGDP